MRMFSIIDKMDKPNMPGIILSAAAAVGLFIFVNEQNVPVIAALFIAFSIAFRIFKSRMKYSPKCFAEAAGRVEKEYGDATVSFDAAMNIDDPAQAIPALDSAIAALGQLLRYKDAPELALRAMERRREQENRLRND